MRIKFLGAAGTVTGSGYLVTSDSGQQLLIDLGLFQGLPEIEDLNYQPLQLDAGALSGVILTHAHLDHCGRLPVLGKMGLSAGIHMTAPTVDLTRLTLTDSAKVSREDHPERILYTKDDVEKLIAAFRVAAYDRRFDIGAFGITFRDAGHILGSASVELNVDGRTVVFSGDLGNTPEDLNRPTSFIESAEVVIMESTYGGRIHPEGNAADMIATEINIIEKSGGVLLIPAFSLERTQELLHMISHLKSAGRIRFDLPVFMDSPMAQRATGIYEKYHSLLNDEIKKEFLNSNPFDFPGLQEIKSPRESFRLDRANGPKVIIAGGGMMTGGRIVRHSAVFLPMDTTRLVIVGYQGEGTLGRELLSGAKEVFIDERPVTVKAAITDIQVMSSHADERQLLDWLGRISGVKKVILTHGEDQPRHALAQKITSDLHLTDISFPVLNQELEIAPV